MNLADPVEMPDDEPCVRNAGRRKTLEFSDQLDPPRVTRRPETSADATFLHSLLLERTEEELQLDHLPAPMKEQILGMQARLRLSSVRGNYPHAVSEIILAEGEPAGWVCTQENANHIRLVEITICSKLRGRGIGSAVLKELVLASRSTRKPIRLHVGVRNTAAFRLYQRLGFQRTGGDEVQHEMEHG